MMSHRSIVPSPNEVQLFHSLSGIQRLAETRCFKARFLDQFGVLHDGKQPYPEKNSRAEGGESRCDYRVQTTHQSDDSPKTVNDNNGPHSS
ncbi:hypothetical protein SAY86_020926 [Trapa natans]|uniref:Uncharacterized protein n=1 Tax=Trapa natans TaxID=22666 RepID=A0AAN7M7R1_TRANT|nr:hypothetical protein SAY86_020926 [Trapa natans]